MYSHYRDRYKESTSKLDESESNFRSKVVPSGIQESVGFKPVSISKQVYAINI